VLVDLCPGGRRVATGDPVGPDGEVPEGFPALFEGAGALVREDNDGIPSTGLVVLRDIAKIANRIVYPPAKEGHKTEGRLGILKVNNIMSSACTTRHSDILDMRSGSALGANSSSYHLYSRE